MLSFQPYYPAGFDLARATELAQLAGDAYTEFEDTQMHRVWQAHDLEDVTKFHGSCKPDSLVEWAIAILLSIRAGRLLTTDESFGFVGRRGDDVFVVFRGTDSIADLLSDLHMFQVALPSGVHPLPTPDSEHACWTGTTAEAGVARMYESMRDEILTAVRAAYAPGRRLFVTGHSLGAALTVLAAIDLAHNTPFRGAEAPVIYNFGSPRIANFALADAFHRSGITLYRVVHLDDPVPVLPPPIPLGIMSRVMRGRWYYSHVGIPVNIGSLYAADATPGVTAAHAIVNYQQALALCAEVAAQAEGGSGPPAMPNVEY